MSLKNKVAIVTGGSPCSLSCATTGNLGGGDRDPVARPQTIRNQPSAMA